MFSLGDQRCGSENNPKPTNPFPTPQTFPIYLKRLVSIKQRENKVILGGTCLYL